MQLYEKAKMLMEILWLRDLSPEKAVAEAGMVAMELAVLAAMAEGRVDDLLRSFPGHFELVIRPLHGPSGAP